MKVKTQNRKELQVQVLVNSGYIYIEINKQLVKEEKIQTKPMDQLFEVFNTNKPRIEKLPDIHHWKLR